MLKSLGEKTGFAYKAFECWIDLKMEMVVIRQWGQCCLI